MSLSLADTAPMADEQFTCCPNCRTVYRVTQQQLEMRGGNVRCGHCQKVFDGVAQLVAVGGRATADDEADIFDEAAMGPPTVTLRDGHALEAPPSQSAAGLEQPPTRVTSATSTDIVDDVAPIGKEPRLAGTDRDGRRTRIATVASGFAIPLLILVFIGQLVYHYRDLLAVHVPAMRPILAEACRVAGCTVGAPREIADLAIESSDLQADPAHQGLLVLTATLRNRGDIPLAYPYLELSLTDAQDQIVVRRALAPTEYVPGTTDLARGIPARSDVTIKLFVDASATTQAGYRLYLFYL